VEEEVQREEKGSRRSRTKNAPRRWKNQEKVGPHRREKDEPPERKKVLSDASVFRDE